MQKHLPAVTSIVADDEVFCSAAFPGEPIGVAFTNGVFNQMEAWRVFNVLKKMADISEVIIVGEAEPASDIFRSEFNVEPAYYRHPYKKWLTEFGFGQFEYRSAVTPRPQCDGFMISRRLQPSA